MEEGEAQAAAAIPEVEPDAVAALEDGGEVGVVPGGDEEVGGPVAVEVEHLHRARPALGREPPEDLGGGDGGGRGGPGRPDCGAGGRRGGPLARGRPRERRPGEAKEALVALGHQGVEIASLEGEGDRSRLAEQGHRLEPAAGPRAVRGNGAPGMAETGDDEVAEAVTVEVGGEGADRAREPADKAGHPPVLPFRSRRIEAHHRSAGRIAGGERADQGDEPGAALEGSEVNGRRVDGDLRHRPEGAVVDPHPAARAVADEDPTRRLVDEDGGDRGGLAVGPGRGQPDREPGGGPVRRRGGKEALRRRPVPVVIEDLRPVGERKERFRRVRAGGKARVRPPSPPAELVDPEPRPHLREHVAGPGLAVEGGRLGHRVAAPAPRRREGGPRPRPLGRSVPRRPCLTVDDQDGQAARQEPPRRFRSRYRGRPTSPLPTATEPGYPWRKARRVHR